MARDKRVLVVYQQLPLYRQDVFRALQETPGLDVTFAAGNTTWDPGIAPIPDGVLDSRHTLSNHWKGGLLWQSGLIGLLRRQHWDAVIFLGDFKYASTWVGSAFLRSKHVPVLFWTIGWHRPEHGIKRWARLAFYRMADHLLLYGNVAREWGQEAGYPPQRMTTIFNSSAVVEEPDAAVDRSAHLRDLLPAPGTPSVGAVIRLSPQKLLPDLIRAIACLNATRADKTHVVLAGDGPERDALVALAREEGVPLHLTGALYAEPELDLVYDAIDVTVIPTLAGLTVLQSFRFGTPVVTHDDPTAQVPEFEAITPGVTGEFYRRGDLNDMARAIGAQLSRVENDRDGVAERCRATVAEQWSAKNQARIIAAVLENL